MKNISNLRVGSFRSEVGQAVAEYAVMLVMLMTLLTVAMGLGTFSSRVFSWVALHVF